MYNECNIHIIFKKYAITTTITTAVCVRFAAISSLSFIFGFVRLAINIGSCSTQTICIAHHIAYCLLPSTTLREHIITIVPNERYGQSLVVSVRVYVSIGQPTANAIESINNGSLIATIGGRFRLSIHLFTLITLE
ncbi:hypothetical protein BLOT_000145 [Blomia tropicalis]|nr:hypothetical protein BLOT_000145 [Blomia tropicalis]